jgi:tetratricopeptide (TPR) repeat protein
MTRTIFAGIALAFLGAAILPAQKPKSKPEVDAINAMFMAAQGGDNDGTIKAAEELMSKFKDTEFKATALLLEAQAYHAKNDDDHAQIYGEQSMAADPKGYQAPLLVGEVIVRHTRENDLDKEEKLATAEKDLNLSIENIKAAAKPNPNLPDAQWEEARKFNIAEAQANIGRISMLKKKYADAIAPLQAAVDGDPQQATYYVWLASAQQQAGKNDDAIATVDKLLAQPNLSAQFRQVATAIKTDATKAKGGK